MVLTYTSWDRKLHNAVDAWLCENAYQCYDTPEQALGDMIKRIHEWATEWIDNTREPDPYFP